MNPPSLAKLLRTPQMESQDGASPIGIVDVCADGSLEGKQRRVWIA